VANENDTEWIIDTMPTKELFIDMLTRDIPLSPTILDLADNCADGAKRLHSEGNFKDLWARIEVSPKEFRIADNCGGIPVEVARRYAFRFGRAPGAPSIKHSVGQFGVGMKRAIFKMGRKFTVESATPTSRFTVKVDVDGWASKPQWEFEFSQLEENIRVPREEQGTTIQVEALHQDVAETFSLSSFETELKNALQSRLQDPISKGLSITLNQIPVTAEPLRMLSDRRLLPASTKLRYQEKGGKPVVVKLYCGLGESEHPEAAGWHIFCNGRLIVEGEKSEITGWGWKEDVLKIPGFHAQFNYVRGYAYFDCDDAARLPWNTTKTGVNTDSTVYRAVRLEMMKLMRPVVDFCNKLKEEKEGQPEEGAEGPLQSLVSSAVAKPIASIGTRDVFEMPKVKAFPVYRGPVLQRIQYDRPLDKVNEVMAVLGVRSFVKVGEKTFDYFYNAEVGE
jgi:Histidine kinase-, DNA gyrase B-, and HSP90-like ATPase